MSKNLMESIKSIMNPSVEPEVVSETEIVASEEVEQIDELSKKTLKSYTKKAITSSERAWNNADKEEDKSMATDGEKYPEKQKRHMDNAVKHINTWNKREAGLKIAAKKIKENEDILENEDLNQLDEVSKETIISYRNKAKADPAFEKKRGKPAKATLDTRAKRERGLDIARKALNKIYAKDSEDREKNHLEVIKHVRDNIHDTLKEHGYNFVGSDSKHSLYAKHLPGTAVMNHAIVHHDTSDGDSYSKRHVLSMKSTTGWQGSGDNHYVESHKGDYSSQNTKHNAMSALHDHIKSFDDRHAEKAKDSWLYR